LFLIFENHFLNKDCCSGDISRILPFFFVCDGFSHEKELHNCFHHQSLEVSGQIGQRLEKEQSMDVQDLKQTVD